MRRVLRENGLSLALFIMFAVTLGVGQLLCGLHESNKANAFHGKPQESLREYITGSHFLEATARPY
jgi:hypothetical protein